MLVSSVFRQRLGGGAWPQDEDAAHVPRDAKRASGAHRVCGGESAHQVEAAQQVSEGFGSFGLAVMVFNAFLAQSLPHEEDRKMVSRLRPILQVTTREKWDALMNGLLRESSLRRAIDYYGELRKEGIRTEREV